MPSTFLPKASFFILIFLLAFTIASDPPGSFNEASIGFDSSSKETNSSKDSVQPAGFLETPKLNDPSPTHEASTFDEAPQATDLKAPNASESSESPSNLSVNGENVKFSQKSLDSPAAQTFWCGSIRGQETGIVVLTQLGSIYQSLNFGESFMKVPHTLFEVTPTFDSATEQIRVKTITTSPSDSMYFAVIIERGDLFVTSDCFRSLKRLNPPLPVNRIQYHGNSPGYLLGGSKECPKANDPRGSSGTFDVSAESKCKGSTIFASRDHGGTWTIMASNVGQYSWGIVDRVTATPIPQDRVYFIQYSTGKFYYTDSYSRTNVEVILKQKEKNSKRKSMETPFVVEKPKGKREKLQKGAHCGLDSWECWLFVLIWFIT